MKRANNGMSIAGASARMVILAIMLVMCASPALADTYNWDGSATWVGDYNWDGYYTRLNGTRNYNWNIDSVPVNGDTANINGLYTVTYRYNGSSLTLAAVNVSGGATLNLQSGTLKTGVLTLNSTSTVNQTGTTLAAGTINLNSGGTFKRTGGALAFTTFNHNGGTFGDLFSPADHTLEVASGSAYAYTTNGGPFYGRLVLQGGSSASFARDFTAANGMANSTALTFSGTRTLTLNGAGLNNQGTIRAQSGTLTINASGGTGGVTNNGTFRVDSGATMIISPSGSGTMADTFKNYHAATSTLTGGVYDIAGTLQLPLRTYSYLFGIIPYEDRQYILNNQATIILDGPNALIRRDYAATENALSNFTTNDAAGVFTLKNGQAFQTVVDFTNKGTVNIESGSSFTAKDGNVLKGYTNTTSGAETIMNKGSLIANTITNNGIFSNIGAGAGNEAVFSGDFINAGTFTAVPLSSQVFTNLTINSSGTISAGGDARFSVGNNFINRSTDSAHWDTTQADLIFVSGTDASHDLYLSGVDMGKTYAGYANNFAWDTLDITGQTITLFDGNSANGSGGALYVRSLLGAAVDTVNCTVSNINGAAGLFIYYDPQDLANSYLEGKTFLSAGGAGVAPVPIPGTLLMLGTGLIGLLCVRKRYAAATEG